MSSLLAPVLLPSPLIPFRLHNWPDHAPQVWVKRDDMIHPIVSGNKWRKLAHVKMQSGQTVVSIGGGFSNHLHALGYLCKSKKAQFIALIRGDYSANPTPMIQDLQTWGAHIHYITKAQYREREADDFIRWVHTNFGECLYVPEGGSSEDALKGIATMMDEIDSQMDKEYKLSPSHYIAPVASGATLAGMIQRAAQAQFVLGVAVLNGAEYIQQQVSRFLAPNQDHWSINHDFVGKGYAKSTLGLQAFCDFVGKTANIDLEPVYSGKAFFALDQLIMQDHFAKTDKIVIVHTGGLQATRTKTSKN